MMFNIISYGEPQSYNRVMTCKMQFERSTNQHGLDIYGFMREKLQNSQFAQNIFAISIYATPISDVYICKSNAVGVIITL